ncbi:radical SAM/SPASM domain-containing protein [Actinosynnema sp. NPDC059335]|uniref:radical SAM/SPASM domain-containing protein n=1 Tax=Actinosynnema sp. NPDC059335 TaxID=3346804 RepID=UPI0036730AD4
MLRWLSLELTGRCQLRCTHCYANSSPLGTHGTMTTVEWSRVIDQAAEQGVEAVQFIGGEPTTHPAFPLLVRHALSRGLAVEVYSNLVHVSSALWRLFEHSGITLATSYYSDRADEHEAITSRRHSHARTRANIAHAVGRGIPIRVAIIEVHGRQRTRQARAELGRLGVSDINVDRVRRIGRAGAGDRPVAAELCGRCGHDRLAIGPDGEVRPCALARSASVGDIRDGSLRDMHAAARSIAAESGWSRRNAPCQPSGDVASPDRVLGHVISDRAPTRPPA